MGILVAWQSGKGVRVNRTPLSLGSFAFFPGDALRVQLDWGSAGRLFFFGRQVCLFVFLPVVLPSLVYALGWVSVLVWLFGFSERLGRFVGVEGAFLFSGVNLNSARIPLR